MKKRLNEVSLLRPITICLLVIMHAFTMYGGNWPLPEGIQPVRAYFWVQKISYSCMLEMFVFLSGYVFGYQLSNLKSEYTLKKLIITKFRRLIIPSMFFSFLFILCFSDLFQKHQWLSIAHVTIAGYSHLWFLPMLFWCFVGGWVINKCRINDVAALSMLLVLSFFSSLPLDFQLSHTCYFLFYFYLGMVLFKKRNCLEKLALNNSIGLYLACVAYIVLTVLQTRSLEVLSAIDADGLLECALLKAQINACTISYALSGVLIIFLLAMRYVTKHTLSDFTIRLNSYCFGIYIIQQFVFMIIYYNSSLPIVVGTYWLPWVGTVISLVCSYCITRLILFTRMGKFLLE